METEMTETHTIIISLGSNYETDQNMARAREYLHQLLPDAVFTQNLPTEPIGMNGPWFLNCLCKAHTSATLDEVLLTTKSLEELLGDSRQQREHGRVVIDIDILQYDDERLHVSDWERPYISVLMSEVMRLSGYKVVR